MDSIPHSPLTSSPSHLSHVSGDDSGATLRQSSNAAQLPDLEEPNSPPRSSPPSYPATEDASTSTRARSTSLEIPVWHGSRTRRDSLDVERERRQRRATLHSSSSSSSPPPSRTSVSPFVLPSPLSPLLYSSSSRRRESERRTPSPLPESQIRQPTPIRRLSAAFLLSEEELRHPLLPPPPPYRPQSPNDYLGVVERWVEGVPNPHYVAPGSAAAHVRVQGGEDVPTAEHIEYAEGFRIPWEVGGGSCCG